jgi:hypothetical protein
MAKLPALQFYPGDWRKDPGVRALDYEERGVWFELLLVMFESEERGKLVLNGAPMTDEMVGKLLGIHGNKWKKIKRKLEVTGVASIEEKTGTLYNRRMVRDEEVRKIHQECGRLGGNPYFHKGQSNPYYDNQNDNRDITNEDNQKITPSSSSSSSSSDKEKEIFKEKENSANGIGHHWPKKTRRKAVPLIECPECKPKKFFQGDEAFEAHFEQEHAGRVE